MIHTWTMLKLKEFDNYSKQVYENLDGWIITAVQKENEGAQKVV